MSMNSNSRRQFLRQLAISAPVFFGARALSQETPPATPPAAAGAGIKLTLDDPVAKALGYTEDATTVDATKFPMHKPGQHCANCALYMGKPDATEGPCQVFQNKIVHAKGWCVSYAPKPPANPDGGAPAAPDAGASDTTPPAK